MGVCTRVRRYARGCVRVYAQVRAGVRVYAHGYGGVRACACGVYVSSDIQKRLNLKKKKYLCLSSKLLIYLCIPRAALKLTIPIKKVT